MIKNIPITKACFEEDDLAIIQEPLKSGWVVQGKYVKQFEDLFSGFSKSKSSVATSNCTTGLHIAMSALGLKPGDEVIVPAFTWISSANCVEYMGATPIFVDVDLATFNLDISKIEACISPRTVGIIPVHLFGLVADMDPIMNLAKKHNLWVVEDAACAFDSYYKGRHAGVFGDAGCFSFHPRKAITTGEGGMITTQDETLAGLCRTLRDHGASRSDFQRHNQQYSFLLAEYHHLGYNFRMTDIQGALGTTQMAKAKKIQEGRRFGARVYDELLKKVEWLQLPYKHEDFIHGYQSYVCLLKPTDEINLSNVKQCFDKRNSMMHAMEQLGIVTRQGTHAAAHLDFYSKKYNIKPEDYPNAYIAERMTITLPLYYDITMEECMRVTEVLIGEYAKD